MRIASMNQTTEQRRDLILGGPILGTMLFLSVPTIMLGCVQALMPLWLADGITAHSNTD
jgi:hypothetical protein